MGDAFPLSGSLKITPLTAILTALQRSKKTGALIVSRNDQERIIYIRNGDVIFAASKYIGDGFGEMMLKTGRLTLDQFERASAEVRLTKKRLGTVLVELGYISPKDLFNAVTFQVKEIILSLFTWIDGAYRFDDGPLPSEEVITLKMSVANLILEGIKRIQDWSFLRSGLPDLSIALEMTTDPLILFQDMQLKDEERALLAAIDGRQSIRGVFAASDLNAFETLKLLRFFLAIGLARPVIAPAEAAAEPDAQPVVGAKPGEVADEAPPPTHDLESPPPIAPEARRAEEVAVDTGAPSLPPEPEPLPTRDEVFERSGDESLGTQKITDAYQALAQQNHYEVLGVTREASRDEVKRAYFRLAKMYHPDRHFQPGMSGLKETLETLFRRITEAYDTLLMERTRKAYDAELTLKKFGRRDRRERTVGPADKAAHSVAEAQAAWKNGDTSTAVYLFEQAVAVAPDRAAYHTLLAQALSQLKGRQRDAETHFKRAIELEPATAENYIGLGLLYKAGKFDQRALQRFEEALVWDPDNTTARNEIRKLKQGK